MSYKLVVFDSHPVQYRVPIWRSIEAKQPGTLHVVYASDCSVRGYADAGFGKTFAWDDPMLDGYEHTVLNCENGKPLAGWKSLTGEGVGPLMDKLKPEAILLTGLNYKYDSVVYLQALKRGIPVWLRCETQDEAVTRGKLKSVLRGLIYRFAYTRLRKVFYIGELNRKHFLNHGVHAGKLFPAKYSTVDRFKSITEQDKQNIRVQARKERGIDEEKLVIGFSGKFITKKNPDILFSMLSLLPEELRSRVHLYFLGSGEREGVLREQAKEAQERYQVSSYFAGFVNQSELPSHYLAMDVMILPSRRMGETWGLVANEAMQAGCSVLVSDAVGCSADFGNWERFQVFKEGDAADAAKQVTALAAFARNFNWATKGLEDYSIDAIADSIIKQMR